MTEQEWLDCDIAVAMLYFLYKSATNRKLRLSRCAWCRLHPCQSTHFLIRSVVETAERYADGEASEAECRAASETLSLYKSTDWKETTIFVDLAGCLDAEQNDRYYLGADDPRNWNLLKCNIYRDIFGPLPFRPITFDRAWLTSSVTSLAGTIYNDHAFDRLPVLADALEEAGCTNADLLTHCRGPSPHVRGCWVVDLLLGKE